MYVSYARLVAALEKEGWVCAVTKGWGVKSGAVTEGATSAVNGGGTLEPCRSDLLVARDSVCCT